MSFGTVSRPSSYSLTGRRPFRRPRRSGPYDPPRIQADRRGLQHRGSAVRLKEFERLKMAYPNSQYMEAIEAASWWRKWSWRRRSRRPRPSEGIPLQGRGRPAPESVVMAIQLLKHPLIGTFDRARVSRPSWPTRTAAAASADPASYEGIPGDQRTS